MPNFDSVCVIGLGYIGLPTAAVLANNGWRVFGVDIDPSVVESVGAGRAHFEESNLDELLQGVVASSALTVSLTPREADVFVIAVPTPLCADKKPDLSFVEAAVDQIIPLVKEGDLIILESTVPPGTTMSMVSRLGRARPDLTGAGGVGKSFFAAHCPERVLPGKILTELVNNDRIIGGITPSCAARAKALYQSFVKGACITTTAETAELTKLAENSFRDVNIAFANELSMVCDELGIDVWELLRLANRHPRVNILNPGPGVGGHCIAVDPWFIADAAADSTPLIQTARKVNDSKPAFVIEKIREAARKSGKERPVIACLGLAFKADVGDLRESPALEITESLAREKVGEIIAVEPYLDRLPPSLEDLGVRLQSLEQALTVFDILVLLVDHKQFRSLANKMDPGRIVVDTRGMLE